MFQRDDPPLSNISRFFIGRSLFSLFRTACLREELLCKVTDPVRDCCHKVSIVGAGMVGIGVANAILLQV